MNGRIDDALAVLTAPECAPIVDFALCRRDGIVEAHGPDGSVGFTVEGVQWVRGRNPLEHQRADAFSPLEAERAALRPANSDNRYPFAYDNIAHLFEDPRAPDIAVVHTPAHNWEDRGGHRGEHGSPDLVQARAPLIATGKGIRAGGSIPAAARMIDIAPTLGALCGVEPHPDGNLLRSQHGRVLDEILDPSERPSQVVAFLCDGSNANVLYAMARAGELPNTARLMEGGTVFEHGLIASFPTVTLANHTTALTGVHPGRHGVLHNAYFDRSTGRQIITNSPSTWHTARGEINPDLETIFEAIARSGGATLSINEPSDRGATSSTFDAVRHAARTGGSVADQLQAALPDPAAVPHATLPFVRERREYAWSTAADHMAVEQVRAIWAEHTPPRLSWINLILNDAGSHAGGPYSDIGYAALRDTDARLGAILDLIDWGAGETAFLLLSDHGMEESDPECTGDYTQALTDAGLRFRDEGFGFLYLDPMSREFKANGRRPGSNASDTNVR